MSIPYKKSALFSEMICSSTGRKRTFASLQVLLVVELELLFQWQTVELSTKSELPVDFVLRDWQENM